MISELFLSKNACTTAHMNSTVTGEVAASSCIDVLLPSAAAQLTLPRDTIVCLVTDVVWSEITDLETLEVGREILERHPIKLKQDHDVKGYQSNNIIAYDELPIVRCM